MEHNVGAGGIVINKRTGKIVLVKNSNKFWGFPKGKVESGEELFQTAKREIYEETSISQLDLISDLGSYERYQLLDSGKEDPKVKKTIHMYVFQTETDDINSNDENIGEIKWVEKNEVGKYLYHPKDKEFYLSIYSKI